MTPVIQSHHSHWVWIWELLWAHSLGFSGLNVACLSTWLEKEITYQRKKKKTLSSGISLCVMHTVIWRRDKHTVSPSPFTPSLIRLTWLLLMHSKWRRISDGTTVSPTCFSMVALNFYHVPFKLWGDRFIVRNSLRICNDSLHSDLLPTTWTWSKSIKRVTA